MAIVNATPEQLIEAAQLTRKMDRLNDKLTKIRGERDDVKREVERLIRGTSIDGNEVMLALAELGSASIGELTHHLGADRKAVRFALDKLNDRNMVAKHGNTQAMRYHLTDGALAEAAAEAEQQAA